MLDRERWPLIRAVDRSVGAGVCAPHGIVAWRIAICFVLPEHLADEADPREGAARRIWQANIDPPSRVHQMSEVDGSQGLIFDGFLMGRSPGRKVDAAVAVAMRSVTAAGIEIIGEGPTEIWLTSLPAEPADLPGYPSWDAAARQM